MKIWSQIFLSIYTDLENYTFLVLGLFYHIRNVPNTMNVSGPCCILKASVHSTTYSTAELGSNPGIIFIKRQDIPLDRKFPKLFDGICCHSVSVEQKKSYSAFFEIFHYLKKKSSTKFIRESSNLLIFLKMTF